jgi:hypothetical protein
VSSIDRSIDQLIQLAEQGKPLAPNMPQKPEKALRLIRLISGRLNPMEGIPYSTLPGDSAAKRIRIPDANGPSMLMVRSLPETPLETRYRLVVAFAPWIRRYPWYRAYTDGWIKK